MARKRLSDLLREAAGEPEGDSNKAQSNSSNAQASSRSQRSSARKPRSKAAPAQAASNPTNTTEETIVAPAVSLMEEPSANTKALEQKINQLQSDLDAANRTQADLKQHVIDLQLDLQAGQELVTKLQIELKQAQRYKAELAEAKQTILQLSEVNTRLTQDLEALNQPKAVSQQVQPNAAKPEPIKPQAIAPHIAIAPTPAPSRFPDRELRKILRHPIQAEQPSTALTDAEIGWVD